MTRIVMDEVLREKLQGANQGLEITDEQGNVVGHFLREDSLSRVLEAMFPPLTDEERAEARRAASCSPCCRTRGCPTARSRRR